MQGAKAFGGLLRSRRMVTWILELVRNKYGGYMKFLTKFGQIINRALQIAGIFSPIVSTTAPQSTGIVQTVSTDLAEVAGVITNVEAFGQALSLKGPDKLKAAVGPVSQIILQSSLLANHKIALPDLFTQGSTKIADGMADVLNSLNPEGIQTTNKS